MKFTKTTFDLLLPFTLIVFLLSSCCSLGVNGVKDESASAPRRHNNNNAAGHRLAARRQPGGANVTWASWSTTSSEGFVNDGVSSSGDAGSVGVGRRRANKERGVEGLRKRQKNKAHQLSAEEGGDGSGAAAAAVKSGSALRRLINEIKFKDSHEISGAAGRDCNFESKSPCGWEWDKRKEPGFHVTTGEEVTKTYEPMSTSGALEDVSGSTKGHFLLLAFKQGDNTSDAYNITSPWFASMEETCSLEFLTHMGNMESANLKLLIQTGNLTTWYPMSLLGNSKNMWEKTSQRVGKMKLSRLSIEVIPSTKAPAHIAFDDIKLVDCFPVPQKSNTSCDAKEFRCSNGLCIKREKICDLKNDCPFGDDEKQNCDRMPPNTSCNFESGWCGWTNKTEHKIHWERRNRRSENELTGPQCDHTTPDELNCTRYFLYVKMKQDSSNFKDRAILQSPLFAPPPAYHQNESSPYYNSCQLRFAYHMFGPHMGSLHADIYDPYANPMNPGSKGSKEFWRSYGDKGNIWHFASIPLPKINCPFHIVFTAFRGHRYMGDIAIDDVSLSPECVGLGVPAAELHGYKYEEALNSCPRRVGFFPPNATRFEFSTCNHTGRIGPTLDQCQDTYKETTLNNSVEVVPVPGTEVSGVQVWTVPATQHYFIVAKGASGGSGARSNENKSFGTVAKAILHLKKNDKIYMLVGQQGSNVCDQESKAEDFQKLCPVPGSEQEVATAIQEGSRRPSLAINRIKHLNQMAGGGGGGGGGTFIWRMDVSTPVPLLIAGGGGGLAYNSSNTEKYLPAAKGNHETSEEPYSGDSQPFGAGGGGGWRGGTNGKKDVDKLSHLSGKLGTQPAEDWSDPSRMWMSAGLSVLDGGGLGGLPCNMSHTFGAPGGFGGGGGGCFAGGAGGGFIGGNAHGGIVANGEGGYSYIIKGTLFSYMDVGLHEGPGEVVILPSVPGACGCEYHCVLLDDKASHTQCVCPEGSVLDANGHDCSGREGPFPLPYMIALVLACLVIFASVGLLCICLYSRYQKQKAVMLRRKGLGGPELQLSRIRQGLNPNGVLTEYNPNYEFGGETYNLTDLKELPRENLQLVRALGQGAFGEVYQGFYKQRATDSVEMPVAVKTLPELSSNQAEMDFLMEALIMSKFNHPNIVHFIGVCFDRHPRFIILELLAGGDLKTFLRESRPKPERASPLTMKDLLSCAVEVAKGCKYLEENHFIHRDIAARNCLLTTKGPGRTVKIADFGMARDIYRADYYKKGGKAMLPVKWMPPEAFMDGIFTSKTDVWSYGVLLWEVMSLGYMPYPGRGNQDVMQLVTNGGRLEPPTNCPAPVYGIMTQCWHPIPEERPTFATLLERVGYCLQDPEVVNAPLPVFQRPPSSERDATLMRPNNPGDSSCLRVIHGHRSSNATTISANSSSAADYLVPLTPYSLTGSVGPGSVELTSYGSNTAGAPSGASRKPKLPAGDSKDSNNTLPESQSAETLLDDDGEGALVSSREAPTKGGAPLIENGLAKRSTKLIDNGLTLTPSTLRNSSSHPATTSAASAASTTSTTLSPNSIKPGGPYANVGMRRSDLSDEEIRC